MENNFIWGQISKNFLFSAYRYIKSSKNIVVTSIDTAAYYSMFLKKNIYFITQFKKKIRPTILLKLRIKIKIMFKVITKKNSQCY